MGCCSLELNFRHVCCVVTVLAQTSWLFSFLDLWIGSAAHVSVFEPSCRATLIAFIWHMPRWEGFEAAVRDALEDEQDDSDWFWESEANRWWQAPHQGGEDARWRNDRWTDFGHHPREWDYDYQDFEVPSIALSLTMSLQLRQSVCVLHMLRNMKDLCDLIARFVGNRCTACEIGESFCVRDTSGNWNFYCIRCVSNWLQDDTVFISLGKRCSLKANHSQSGSDVSGYTEFTASCYVAASDYDYAGEDSSSIDDLSLTMVTEHSSQ